MRGYVKVAVLKKHAIAIVSDYAVMKHAINEATTTARICTDGQVVTLNKRSSERLIYEVKVAISKMVLWPYTREV